MGEFALGPIKIVDNGDGIYRAPVKGSKNPQDEVQDSQGKVVSATGAEAQKALKELGVSSLVGLKLSPASRYLENLSQAKNFASQGDCLQTEERLLQARLAAEEAKLPFSEDRAAAILKTSLEKELDLLVARATKLADAGDVLALTDVFSAGREILSRLQVPFDQAKSKGYAFHQDLIDQLEPKAYAKALPVLWKKAEAAAKAGEVARCQESVAKIREYAKRAQVSLTGDEEKRLVEFERSANEVAVGIYLNEASVLALQGDVDGTRSTLAKVKDAAVLAKTPLSAKQEKQAAQCEQDALKNAPAFLLPLAEAKADLGDVEATRAFIQKAKDARAQVGLKLDAKESAKALAAEQKALRLSVDVLLGNAAAAVKEVKKNGNLSKVKAFITQARENAALAKLSFSSAQETSAANILAQAYQAAVDWRFGQAASSAALGKVDDTIVPLNAGRELAKQGGATFDEAAAQKLIDEALEKGIELEFSAAEKFASAGDRVNTQFHLELARDDARRLGKKFDEARAKKILKLLPAI